MTSNLKNLSLMVCLQGRVVYPKKYLTLSNRGVLFSKSLYRAVEGNIKSIIVTYPKNIGYLDDKRIEESDIKSATDLISIATLCDVSYGFSKIKGNKDFKIGRAHV